MWNYRVTGWRRNGSCTAALHRDVCGAAQSRCGVLALTTFGNCLAGLPTPPVQITPSSGSPPGPWPAHPSYRHPGKQLGSCGNGEGKKLVRSFSFALLPKGSNIFPCPPVLSNIFAKWFSIVFFFFFFEVKTQCCWDSFFVPLIMSKQTF